MASRTKAARTSLGGFERVNDLDAGVRNWSNHHLCDAHAVSDGEGFAGVVDKGNQDLAAIIAIDGARRVGKGNAVFGRKPRTRANLGFESYLDSDGQPGGNNRDLAGLDGDTWGGLWEARREVKPRCTRSLVNRNRSARIKKFDLHLWLVLSACRVSWR